MEGSAYTERTIDVVKKVRLRNPAIGTVIQAYLYRSEQDIQDLLAIGCRIRLCKARTKSRRKLLSEKEDVDSRLRGSWRGCFCPAASITASPRMIRA
jgi:proline dehydrogenase